MRGHCKSHVSQELKKVIKNIGSLETEHFTSGLEYKKA